MEPRLDRIDITTTDDDLQALAEDISTFRKAWKGEIVDVSVIRHFLTMVRDFWREDSAYDELRDDWVRDQLAKRE